MEKKIIGDPDEDQQSRLRSWRVSFRRCSLDTHSVDDCTGRKKGQSAKIEGRAGEDGREKRKKDSEATSAGQVKVRQGKAKVR